MTTDRPPPRRRRRTHQGERTASLRSGAERSGVTNGQRASRRKKIARVRRAAGGDDDASSPTDENPLEILVRVPGHVGDPSGSRTDDRVGDDGGGGWGENMKGARRAASPADRRTINGDVQLVHSGNDAASFTKTWRWCTLRSLSAH